MQHLLPRTLRHDSLLTPLIRPGEWGREMDLLTTGSGHRWLGDLLRLAPSELESLAVSSEAGARGLLFAPYLAGGEQGALWDTTSVRVYFMA